MRITFGAMVFVAAVSLATAAPARQAGKRAAAETQTTTGSAAGPVCQRLCEADMAPCDPPEFKRVDGRCTNPSLGGGLR